MSNPRQTSTVKLAVLNRVLPQDARTTLVVRIERRHADTYVVARSQQRHPTVVLEVVFAPGVRDARLKVSRAGEHLELAGDALSKQSAVVALLRLIAEEAERRTPNQRIGFRETQQTTCARSESQSMQSDALLEFLFQSLLVYVERKHVETPLPNWGRTVRDVRIERALTLLNQDLSQRWHVEKLARAVGLSRAVFARRFLAVLGLSPMRYLTERRMQTAAALLFSTDAGLAEIASQVGYDSEFAFGRAFKRYHSVPPGEYRQRMQATTPFPTRMAA